MRPKNTNRIVQPYLFFEGRCEEALTFYRKALGAKVTMLMRYKDSPEPGNTPPNSLNKVLHASFTIGGSLIMASDGNCSNEPRFQGMALTLSVPTAAEATRRFSTLAKGGMIQMPLSKTFFSPRFGMVTDGFGVMWMIMTTPAKSKAR